MGRTESGRRSKKYHVNIRSDEFLVSIKTDKPVALGDLYFVPHLFSYRIVGLLKLVAESICHGRQNNIWVCIQSFHSRSRATASAAYQPYLKGIAVVSPQQIGAQDRVRRQNPRSCRHAGEL